MDDLPIVFQDDFLIVFDKPPGLVVDDSDTHNGLTLSQILQIDYGIKLDRGGIVHRLDKDTSGLIIVAKTQNVLEKLQNQFKERTIKKEYTALVHGTLSEPKNVIGAISRNPVDRHKFGVFPEGKESSTDIHPQKSLEMTEAVMEDLFPEFSNIQKRKLKQLNYQKYTLVRCFPKTGRTHQIRVHLKHIGFPIVSDKTYGGRKVIRLDHRWCDRQFLHASKLIFDHPETQKRLEFESSLPSDLEKSLSYLV